MTDNILFQVVENYKVTSNTCDEFRLIKGIQSEKMEQRIRPIRELLKIGDKDGADKLKSALPAVMISGTFSGRAIDKLIRYSNLICLDLDKIQPHEVERIKMAICNCEYTFIAFLSPSGCGIKVLVKVNSGSNYHRDAYKQVVEYYTKLLGVRFDEKTSDINRLTYMSYDPEPYHFPDSISFDVQTPVNLGRSKVPVAELLPDQLEVVYKQAFDYTSRKVDYKAGNRNNFIHLLSCNANRFGLPKQELLKRLNWSEKPKTEIEATVESAYKKVEDFAKWSIAKQPSAALPAPLMNSVLEVLVESAIKYINCLGNDTKSEIPVDSEFTDNRTKSEVQGSPIQIENDRLSKAPELPKEVFQSLPIFLKDLLNHFDNSRERDLVLLSCLTVLSSAFPNSHGIYDRSKIGMNLFLFVAAPASAGKGQMKWARHLGSAIHKYLQETYISEREVYLHSEIELKEPEEKMFFIPANASSSAIYGQMAKNQNFGVMFDNEGDTLSQMLKTDWSNFSPLLRKAFHNEPLSQLRKAKADCREIEKSYLSVALSGTPNQVSKLIESIENGLFSRFMFLTLEHELKWKNKFSSGGESLDAVFDKAANELLGMWKASHNASDTVIEVEVEEQNSINTYFSKRLHEMFDVYGHDIVPSIYRTCVIWYRIAMILTILRAYQTQDKLPDILKIDLMDCKTALMIVDTLLNHLQVVFQGMNNTNTIDTRGKRQLLNEALPGKFKKSEYLKIADSLGIKQCTANKYLNDLQDDNLVVKMPAEHGWYQKAA